MTSPKIFANLDFDAALAQALDKKSLLLVDATATWCGPCQVMDRTTWADAAVARKLKKVGFAIQVDVDAKPEVSQRLKIQAMPTVIAFRGDVEIDRVVGLQRSEQLLAWIDGLQRGETSLDHSRKELAAKPNDVRARMALARDLLRTAHVEEATAEYVWLWQNMLDHEPTLIGVRHSFLVQEIRQLIAQHPPAITVFEQLRQVAEPDKSPAPDREKLLDWFSLNEIVGHPEATLAWFDEVRDHLAMDPRLGKLLESHVVPLLAKANRWADVAPLYPNPLERLAGAAEMLTRATADVPANAPARMVEQFREYATSNLHRTAAQLTRALDAAGRTAEAAAVREEARRLDASNEMARAIAKAT